MQTQTPTQTQTQTRSHVRKRVAAHSGGAARKMPRRCDDGDHVAAAEEAAAVTRVQRWIRRKLLQRAVAARWVAKRRFDRAINTCEPVDFTPVAEVNAPFLLYDGGGSDRFYVFETLTLARWIMHHGAAVNPYTKARLTRAELRRLDVAARALGFEISLRKRLPSLAIFAAHRADHAALVRCLEDNAYVAGDVLLQSADSSVLYVSQYFVTCVHHRQQRRHEANGAESESDTTVSYSASDADDDGDGNDDGDGDDDDDEHYVGIAGFPHIVRCRDCVKRAPPMLRPLDHGLVHAGARRVPTCCILRMLHPWSVTFASAKAQLFQAGGPEVHDALHARLKSEWAVMKAKMGASASAAAVTATELRRDVCAYLDTLFE
jgi:hypothetical protein